MIDKRADTLDEAYVALALGLTDRDRSDPDTFVTDDELIQLYANTLNEQRRSIVMHTIASDNATYHRWIRQVQSMELADEFDAEAKSATPITGESQKPDDLSRAPYHWFTTLFSSLQDSFGKFSGNFESVPRLSHLLTRPVGLVAAGVFAAMLLPYLMKSTPSGVDELYALYIDVPIPESSQSEALPEKTIDLTINYETRPYTMPETELAKGVNAGFNVFTTLVIPPAWEIDNRRLNDQKLSDSTDADSMNSLGRLVALSLVQCKYAKSDGYFEESALLYKQLGRLADKKWLQDNAEIEKYFTQDSAFDSGNTRDAVCQVSSNIINSL